MIGAVVHLSPPSQFHDLAQIHHGHPVADVPDNRQVVRDEQVGEPNSSWSSSSRLMICAWMDTSRAETGSSHTIILGRNMRARAMPTRCR